MDLSNQINEIIENTKSLALELEEDRRMVTLKNDLSNAAEKTIDHAAKYVIKAMPVPDAVKDILLDIKDAIRTKDVSKVVSTAVNSTVREGLEMLGLSTSSINSLMELKDIAKKGGLITALKNGIEIVAENYLKNNIVGDYVYKFFDKLKNYIMNNEFGKSLDNFIKKLEEKKDKFLEKCEEWYNEYKNMNVEKMNSVASELDNNKYVLSRYTDCVKENNVIQNMTAMVNNKNSVLTTNQQRLCQVI
ncbi:MAG: hypothetical protein IJ272_06340 [Clostridia bacterium]|nr:hypothetical protein [Clostridia bacterium]